MICHEATEKDLPELLPFLNRELRAWGYDPHITLERLQKALAKRWRYAYVTEKDTIVAALAVYPVQTEGGPAYRVKIFLVKRTYPDKVLALDTLTLFGCNALRSEGIRTLISDSPVVQQILYGPDYVGMDVREGTQWGSTEAMIASILKRRPEWQLSP